MKKKLCAIIMCLLLAMFAAIPVSATGQVEIYNNFELRPINFTDGKPFISSDGRTMVPASSLNYVLLSDITVTIVGGTVTIVQQGFEYPITVSVTVGSNFMLRNGETILMDTTPLSTAGQIYIPLRAVGEALEHDVRWNESNTVMISYYAAELYVWNEDEDSSASGVRYTILQGTSKEKPLEEVYAKATANFGDIEPQFEAIKKGKVLQVDMYRMRGYKVPKEISAMVGSKLYDYIEDGCATGERIIGDKPDFIHGTGNYSDQWYSKQLAALGEQNLKSYHHAYRFTYIPSFSAPFTVRIEIADEGTSDLTFTCSDDVISPNGGDIFKTFQVVLDNGQTNKLLAAMQDSGFWDMPTKDERIGLDGSEWIIEGVKDGTYHIVNRWTPEKGPIYDLGNTFVRLCGPQFVEIMNEVADILAERYHY